MSRKEHICIYIYIYIYVYTCMYIVEDQFKTTSVLVSN